MAAMASHPVMAMMVAMMVVMAMRTIAIGAATTQLWAADVAFFNPMGEVGGGPFGVVIV